MSLGSALAIANGGLANINKQFATLSQNVANASTPGYAVEVSSQQALTVGGIGLGVKSSPATLLIDQALRATVINQNATVTGLQTTQTSLQALDSVLGTPGSGNDIGSLLGNLKNSFTTLMADPSNQTQQDVVVESATTLAQGINTLSAAYSAQRQAAQNDLGTAVNTLNSTLTAIGQINNQIVDLQGNGLSTADLQNQRNELVQTLSNLIDIKTVQQPDGSLSVFTVSGLNLPTVTGSTQFSIANASTTVGSYYPNGGLPGIVIGSSQTPTATVAGTTSIPTTGRLTTDASFTLAANGGTPRTVTITAASTSGNTDQQQLLAQIQASLVGLPVSVALSAAGILQFGTSGPETSVTLTADAGAHSGLGLPLSESADAGPADTTDVTSQLTGGEIGADIALRDNILPTYQAELDEFAQGLASRFAAQGLTLFTDSAGNVPAGGGTPPQSGYVGFAASIQTSAAVAADPALVRDGTAAATAATGFTPNPPNGLASFTGLISNILNYAFGTQSSSGVEQPTMNTTDLGADGTLTAPFTAENESLSDFATSLVSSQAEQSANVTSSLATESALQTSLNARVSSVSGVNMDTELSQMLVLQNAYGANARILTTMQSMFTALLGTVQ